MPARSRSWWTNGTGLRTMPVCRRSAADFAFGGESHASPPPFRRAVHVDLPGRRLAHQPRLPRPDHGRPVGRGRARRPPLAGPAGRLRARGRRRRPAYRRAPRGRRNAAEDRAEGRRGAVDPPPPRHLRGRGGLPRGRRAGARAEGVRRMVDARRRAQVLAGSAAPAQLAHRLPGAARRAGEGRLLAGRRADDPLARLGGEGDRHARPQP